MRVICGRRVIFSIHGNTICAGLQIVCAGKASCNLLPFHRPAFGCSRSAPNISFKRTALPPLNSSVRAQMKYIALLLLPVATLSHASDFATRVKAGVLSLASPSGQRYEASWGQAMQASLAACVPVGSTSPANLGKFTFVANVSSSGVVSSVEVEPVTSVSRCFAIHFGAAQLPPPPGVRSGSYLPVADSISVTP